MLGTALRGARLCAKDLASSGIIMPANSATQGVCARRRARVDVGGGSPGVVVVAHGVHRAVRSRGARDAGGGAVTTDSGAVADRGQLSREGTHARLCVVVCAGRAEGRACACAVVRGVGGACRAHTPAAGESARRLFLRAVAHALGVWCMHGMPSVQNTLRSKLRRQSRRRPLSACWKCGKRRCRCACQARPGTGAGCSRMQTARSRRVLAAAGRRLGCRSSRARHSGHWVTSRRGTSRRGALCACWPWS